LVTPETKKNLLLLVASYLFYASWDWRFLTLIWLSTIIDFYCGRKIWESADRGKIWLILSLTTNLGILGVFKYFNFFVENFAILLDSVGLSVLDSRSLNIILPVGISFYTFQSMSYTIDIYRRNLRPVEEVQDFALFVAFFPQLVAGPIERASNLLPQITGRRAVTSEMFYEGCYLVFWGAFLKIFVANNLAPYVDAAFLPKPLYRGDETLAGIYAFAFQIFADFAGYSYMAKGLASCLGFKLTFNFNLPYYSSSPSEFWRRWHISLSQWLRDYLYISLGGSKEGLVRTIRNLLVTMVLGGLWHGAAWSYIMWGAYHGVILVLYRVVGSSEVRHDKPEYFARRFLKKVVLVCKVIFCFHLVCFGWLLFRVESISQVVPMAQGIVDIFGGTLQPFADVLPYVFFMLMIQSYERHKDDLLAVYKLPWLVKGTVYFLIAVQLIVWGAYGEEDFIYFQF